MFPKELFKRDRENTFRIAADSELSDSKIAKQMINLFPETTGKDIVIVCIGSDRATGDCFGPIIGSKLKQRLNEPFFVYGTLNEPVHAVNLQETLTYIANEHPDAFVIGIDACLGISSNVGTITLAQGPVYPGAAMKKDLPAVGDIHLTGIVNVGGYMEMMVLQNTRLSIVMDMAHVVSSAFSIVEIKLKHLSLQKGG
ncbi:spore protease YyaC [Texcoconibacillus texcoconensis]|nr:spore protease YyaC [Texcoconibacillus texcoconensis]